MLSISFSIGCCGSRQSKIFQNRQLPSMSKRQRILKPLVRSLEIGQTGNNWFCYLMESDLQKSCFIRITYCSCDPCFVFPCHKNLLPVNPLHLLPYPAGITPHRISSAPSRRCNWFKAVKTYHFFPFLSSLPCIPMEEDVLYCCISYTEACFPPTIDIIES